MLVGGSAREGFLKVCLIDTVTIICYWAESDEVGPLLSLSTTSSSFLSTVNQQS